MTIDPHEWNPEARLGQRLAEIAVVVAVCVIIVTWFL